ncbi:MAG: hypothetical protein FJY85_03555, partial [Deltaproteobacteria bacterium]|nr:hypothetical protein [Deltaproteobacteria bacterium]
MGSRMKGTRSLVALELVATAAILFGGCASGESVGQLNIDVSKINEVAVVDVIGKIEGETAKNQIADYFGMELLRRGYTPVERTQIQSILKEQQFQTLDVTSATDAVKAGRVLNVSAVVVINVDYGEQMSMTAKMINVEKGTMLWIGSGSGRTGKGLLTIAGAVLGAGTGVAVSGDGTESKVL